ncbi:MAG: hypothetical protein A2236_01570, partial [Bacteroidetes bacterium RIFOXYA2_FULL_33_7]
MRYWSYIFILVFIFLQSELLIAQYKRIGIPFVTNFSPIEYKAGNQNWAITQDSRGVMYFGNIAGLLEFDGTSWKIIDPVLAIAFAKDKDETIFVGGRSDFGYLAPDSIGNIKYVSLLPLVPEPHKNVDNIWSLTCSNNKVYFSSVNGKLFIYENEKISVLEIDKYLGDITIFNNKIFIELSSGLYTLKNNFPIEIIGGELLSNANIRNMFPFGGDTLLIVTRSEGLFIYHNNKISSWETETSSFLKDYQVYLATQLQNGYIAFGTVESGVIIMDKKGFPTQHINRLGGMINDDHCGIYTDKQGNIWSGLEFGISYIHVNSPWSVFNELAGLSTASFLSVALHNNRLYAGNAQGLFSKNWKNDDNPLLPDWNFAKQAGLDARKVWDILPVKNDLLFSSSNVGTYCLNEKSFYKISDFIAPFKLFKESYGNYILGAGEHAGIQIFEQINDKWEFVSENQKIGYISAIEEGNNHHFWACQDEQTILELELIKDSISIIRTYDTLFGLPSESSVSILKLFDKILFGTEKGIYIFDENSKKFHPYDEINSLIGANIYITAIKNDKNGKAWFWAYDNLYDLCGYFEKDKNGKFSCKLFDKPVNKINSFTNNTFLPIDEHNILIGSSNNLVHFDPSISIEKPFFNALIRKVSLPISNDSIIFNGAFLNEKGELINEQNNHEKIVIPYESNSIKFNFSSTYYEEYQRNTYSYKLEGFDTNWSSWSNKTEKEYTNLPEGNYVFMIKSRNLYDFETIPAAYRFSINPPWYRTALAFFIYIILFIAFVYFIVKISIRKIEKEKIKLEKIVQQRTAEVVKQKDEIVLKNTVLEQQKEEISTQNEVLNQQNEEITSQRDEIESQRDMVLKQKEHIELINKEVTDSINYARQIQNALLPNNEISKELIGEHFIIYKPKDIVSGDFYWLVEVENITVVAVADCTGHGVPGGFMSMLGMSLLKEIVVKEYI